MKICKKIAFILIIFILSTVFNVYAADYVVDPTYPTHPTAEVTLTQSSTTTKVGETITITISAKCQTGIEGLDAILEYDKTKLEYVGLEAKNYFTSYSDIDEGTGEFIFSVLYGEIGAPKEAPNEAVLATVSFKVLDTATGNEKLTIKLSEIQVIDPEEACIEVNNQQVTLTIIGNQDPEGGDPEGGNPEDGETKDPTIADKPINDAGIETYGILAIGIAIVLSVLYVKNKKYRDVK